MTTLIRLLLFSDLDGTLLNHHDYRWEGARPALERLRDLGWPLVLVTSKTRAEVEPLRRELELHTPFIVENGGGIFFPPESAPLLEASPWPVESVPPDLQLIRLGVPYDQVRAFVEEEGRALGMEGFGDMDTPRVQELTDLKPEEAARARTREFTEPFRLTDESALAAVREAAARRGLTTTTGGRLHHLMGQGQDKGRAVERVRELYARAWGQDPVTVGLGDGPNDLPMLSRVDHPVILPVPGRGALEHDLPDAVTAPRPAPEGWADAVLRIIDGVLPPQSQRKALS